MRMMLGTLSLRLQLCKLLKSPCRDTPRPLQAAQKGVYQPSKRQIWSADS